jgi:hypothetical protein
MATTRIITINELIKMFDDFSSDHLQLNDFGYGETSDIGTTTQMLFPYLWATHRTASSITVQNRTAIPTINLTFIIADQINVQSNTEQANGFASDNSQEIVSDTFQIAQDFVVYLFSLNTQGVKLIDESLALELVVDETQDKVIGWMIDVSLQLTHTNCAYPTV